MPLLTEKIVLETIKEHEEIYMQEDWWYGSTESFNNAVHGFDVNVYHDFDENTTTATVYELFRNDDELETGDIIFEFGIERLNI